MADKTTNDSSVRDVLRKTIRIDAILMLDENQIRAKTEWRTVRRYAELMAGGDSFPPIRVALTDPTDEVRGYTLVDGWHRVRASQENGWETIVAEVIEAAAEAIPWAAYEANRGHGLQIKLTMAVRREIFKAYVRAGKHRTGRGRKVKTASEMAKDLVGVVSRTRIPIWMAADFPAIYRAMNGNGLEPEGDQGGLKERDMDAEYGKAAKASLDEFMACMRAMKDNRNALAILRQAVACVDEVAEAVTGRREWPRAGTGVTDVGDDF